MTYKKLDNQVIDYSEERNPIFEKKRISEHYIHNSRLYHSYSEKGNHKGLPPTTISIVRIKKYG